MKLDSCTPLPLAIIRTNKSSVLPPVRISGIIRKSSVSSYTLTGAAQAVVINLQPLFILMTTKKNHFTRVISGVVRPKDVRPLAVLLMILLSVAGA